jgi:hypothetical protein
VFIVAGLATGRNPSTVGMNTISEATMGFPGLSGHIPHSAAMVSEVLQERGWSTFISITPGSPLGGGWLTGKYSRDERPTGTSRLGDDPNRGVEA